MKVIEEFRALPGASRRYLLSQFLAAFYFTWPIFILFMKSRFSIEAAGIYYSSVALAQMLSEIPTGYIADRLGQARSVLLGGVVYSLSLMLLLTGRGSYLPLLSGVIGGVGAAFISGAADALIYRNITHKEYEQTMHHTVSVYQAGLIFSSLIGGFLYRLSPSVPFLAQALVIFLAAVPLLGLKEVYEPSEDEPSLHDAGKALKRIFTTRESLLFLIGSTLFWLAIDLLINILLESRMIELAISPSSRGLVIGLVKLAIICVLQLFVLRLVNTVGKKLFLALAIFVLVFPLMGFGHSAVLFIGLYFMFNFVTVFRDAIVSPMAQKLVSSRYRATELSLYSMVRSAAFAGTAVLVGFYLKGHSTKGVFLILSASIAVVGGPLLIWSLRRYNKVAGD